MSTQRSNVTGLVGAVVPTVSLTDGGVKFANDPVYPPDADTVPVIFNNDPSNVRFASPLMVFAVPVPVNT